jgi:hypothetical protein
LPNSGNKTSKFDGAESAEVMDKKNKDMRAFSSSSQIDYRKTTLGVAACPIHR